MISIGFEFSSKQGLSILPGYEFTISILRNWKPISASIGKDIYHVGGFILPDKRITSTGRIHYLSEATINPYESFQTTPCTLLPFKPNQPKQALSLNVKVTLPRPELSNKLIHSAYLVLVKKEKERESRIPLFLDSTSYLVTSPTEFILSVERIIEKHLYLN